MSEAQEIRDLGRHLDEQILERLERTLRLLEVAGHGAGAASAVALSSAETLARTALAIWVSLMPEPLRADMFDAALQKLIGDLQRNRGKVLETVKAGRLA